MTLAHHARQHSLHERVVLPDDPAPGRYDAAGKPDKAGNVFVLRLGPTAHVWAVFSSRVAPEQTATMEFHNVDGDGILDAIVSQWIDGGPGPFASPLNIPYVGEAGIVFLARQRAPGAVKVAGRNASRAAVHVAASVLYIPGSGGG